MINHQKNNGVTLIEIIIVIVILSIIVSVGGVLLGSGFKGGFASRDSIYAATVGRVAIERMGNDILNARSATAADLTPNANSITFISVDGKSITYSLSGTNLMRNSKTLANYVSALSFTYLNQLFVATTTATEVRCIVINMTISYQGNTSNIATIVCPRNYAL
jgi:prepilin-type N-terminal cleavage/methylation domain-containing protein